MADTQTQQQQTSQGDSQAQQSGASTQAQGAGSQSTQATQTQQGSGELQRPKDLPDEFWDDKAGVKTDALVAKVGELAKIQADLAAQKAAVPATPDAYEVKLPADFKLPDGYEIDANDAAWKLGREFAHKNGLNQQQFSALSRVYVEAKLASDKAQNDQIAEAVKARDTALGANGGARVEALNTWFKGVFGEDVGKQFANTLFTPAIVDGFEKLQLAVTNQGITSFSQTGRKEGRTDGRPENWETMSAVDKREWNLRNQMNSR